MLIILQTVSSIKSNEREGARPKASLLKILLLLNRDIEIVSIVSISGTDVAIDRQCGVCSAVDPTFISAKL